MNETEEGRGLGRTVGETMCQLRLLPEMHATHDQRAVRRARVREATLPQGSLRTAEPAASPGQRYADRLPQYR